MFWGVLIWKRKAEEVLLASGIPYTVSSCEFAIEIFDLDNLLLIFVVLFQIVRPGGMERPTDSYKETHNITLSLEDTLFGGQVSNLQVIIL